MKLVTFIRLKREEQIFFLQSFYWLWYFRVRLHHMSFPLLIQQAESKSHRFLSKSKTTELTVNKLVWFFNRASDFVPGATCLVRSLAGKAVFSLYGYEPKLVIGVRKDSSNDLRSHAWLECDGQILVGNEGDIDQYRQIIRFG